MPRYSNFFSIIIYSRALVILNFSTPTSNFFVEEITLTHISLIPFSAVGTSVARSSGSLYCLSGQIPIANPLLTLVYVASRS
jgi:hypothetical protein